MKIVHLGYEHSPEDVRIFYKECVSLAKDGYDVTYITSTREKSDFNITINNVKIITLKVISGSRIKRYFSYLKNLYDIAVKQNADVYHIHEPLLMFVGLKLKKKGKRIIFDSHENFEGYWNNLFFIPKIIRKPLSWVIWRWLLSSIRKSDGVIAATPFIAEQFQKYNIKSTVVSNYPLIDDIQCNMEGYEEREKIACYAGGISQLRGIDNIIKAMEEVDGKFMLAGKLLSDDRQRFEKMNGWNKTEYLGFLNRKDINHIYSKSLVGLVILLPTPNYLESLPIKMFEYMAAGIPVLCSDFPLWKSIITENQCGICVDPTDPNKIAEAINYIFKNKEQIKQMGKNGREAVLTKYNWNIESKKLLGYYNDLK
jgi:glycosyltransferase involved in cell wall biosynthesis